jgi:hypothetical protein
MYVRTPKKKSRESVNYFIGLISLKTVLPRDARHYLSDVE